MVLVNRVLSCGSVNWPCARRRNYPQKPIMSGPCICSIVGQMSQFPWKILWDFWTDLKHWPNWYCHRSNFSLTLLLALAKQNESELLTCISCLNSVLDILSSSSKSVASNTICITSSVISRSRNLLRTAQQEWNLYSQLRLKLS